MPISGLPLTQRPETRPPTRRREEPYCEASMCQLDDGGYKYGLRHVGVPWALIRGNDMRCRREQHKQRQRNSLRNSCRQPQTRASVLQQGIRLAAEPIPRYGVLPGRNHTLRQERPTHHARRHKRWSGQATGTAQGGDGYRQSGRHREGTGNHQEAWRKRRGGEKPNGRPGVQGILQGLRREYRRPLARRAAEIKSCTWTSAGTPGGVRHTSFFELEARVIDGYAE